MKKIIVATIHNWNIKNALHFRKRYKRTVVLTRKKELTLKTIERYDPDYIFFPHWSWWIPEKIYSKYKCIAFHMTDLPFGRGGSPLQNLIVRGFRKTKISAIRVANGFDKGPVYLKCDLSLNGTAQKIYERASKIIFFKMIPRILENHPMPKSQSGKAVLFKRRKPEEGNIAKLRTLKQIYDYIRMLDAEEYPKAFLKEENIVVKLSGAKLNRGKIVAQAEIEVKK